jgi:hypothetical protein
MQNLDLILPNPFLSIAPPAPTKAAKPVATKAKPKPAPRKSRTPRRSK